MLHDESILRSLAGAYAEAAAHPRNAENARLYRALNGLRMIRPVVLIDEEPWGELNGDGSLGLRCGDPDLRTAENYMRRMLYKWRRHPADMILPLFLPVTKIVGGQSGWPAVRERTLSLDGENEILAHEYEDQLASPEDIEKLRTPALTYEKEATEALRDKLAQAVGGVLPVRMTGHSSYISPWDRIATYRGVTPLLMDLADRPDHTHAIMERMTAMYIEQYRQYEKLGLLEGEPALIHCTAGLCDELHTPEDQPVLRRNIWGRGMAQIFASVSAAMHEEFEILYQMRIMENFGLVYYGCCEPLDRKIDVIARLPRLRKISITPWADVRIAAEAIGPRYVLSAKPNPAFVGAGFDEDVIRQEISAILDAARRHGCNVELVLKDISTVTYRPDHLARWERIAMDLAIA